MTLTDKRFWIFEAIVLICIIICTCILWINHLFWFNFAFYLFPVGGAMAWKLYKGNQWWKLAGYLFMITTVLLAFVLFGFVWDWHDTGGRPANIPSDEGAYITDNEWVGIILLLWLIISPFLSCAISLISKRLLVRTTKVNNVPLQL